MLKKITMLVIVVAFITTVAGPSTSMAGVWKHHTQQIGEETQLDLTGQTKFQSGILGFIECQRTTSVTLKPGQSTGTATQFGVDLDEGGSTVTSKCVAGGFLAGCQLHVAESTSLPWTVHNETQRVEVTSGEIDYTLTGGFCAAKRATMTPVNAAEGHSVTWTPNQPRTVTAFAVSAEVEIHLYGQHEGGTPFRTGTAILQGFQTISNINKHTVSLE